MPDIAKYAKKIKEEGNIRLWSEQDLLKAITQYTLLALQMQKLTEENKVTLRRLHPAKVTNSPNATQAVEGRVVEAPLRGQGIDPQLDTTP